MFFANEILANLGIALAMQEQWSEAEQSLQRAAAVAPGRADIAAEIARVRDRR